jgi:hypothetical protein
MTLPVDARLVPRPDVAAREIDDGAVLVNMGSGACFELNRIGFEIWKVLGDYVSAPVAQRLGVKTLTRSISTMRLPMSCLDGGSRSSPAAVVHPRRAHVAGHRCPRRAERLGLAGCSWTRVREPVVGPCA